MGQAFTGQSIIRANVLGFRDLQEPKEAFSESERRLVSETWGQAAALGAENVGVLLFKNIFEIAPEALQLFSFKDEKDLYNSRKLKKHGLQVVSTVGTAVGKLEEPEVLVPILKELALRHVGYSVQAPHYDVVGQALLKTLEAGLGSDYTPEVAAAWTKVWSFVASTMIGAAKSEIAPAAAKAAGADMEALSESERGLVTETWGKAAALGAENVGVLLFKNIFEIAPEALQLFSFKDEKDLYNSRKLKKHGLQVVSTVGTAVGKLEEPEVLVPILKELALRHVGYSVQAPHYDVVGKALLKTLEAGLGSDYTPEVAAAWTKVWSFVASTMIGAAKGEIAPAVAKAAGADAEDSSKAGLKRRGAARPGEGGYPSGGPNGADDEEMLPNSILGS